MHRSTHPPASLTRLPTRLRVPRNPLNTPVGTRRAACSACCATALSAPTPSPASPRAATSSP
eukprot:6182557-Pleurochrysis_carterae.AAC.1